MKKILLGTTVLAVAGFAGAASAAEWDVKVGGYTEQKFGYASVSEPTGSGLDLDGFDVKSDTEIHFKPSITLDNGIKFGAVVELEGNTGGDQIDESYVQISGSFGQVLIGSENSAGYKMSYGAPSVSFMGINSGDQTAWIPVSSVQSGTSGYFRQALGSTFVEVDGNNDAERITYISPRFSGFQVGVSYAGDAAQDSNTQQNRNVVVHDIFDVAANYVNTFGDFNVAVSGRYGIGSNPVAGGTDPSAWAAGLNLGYAGFTVGGSYAVTERSSGAEATGWDAGVSYRTGPWGVSAQYFDGSNDVGVAGTADDEYTAIEVAGTYKVGPGVTAQLSGTWAEGEGGPVGGTTSIDGFYIATGIKLSF